MAIKVSFTALFKKTPRCVLLLHLNSHFSSLPSTTNHNPLPTYGFDANIQYLSRNKLAPDNLVQVLNNTPDLNSAIKLFKWAALQRRFRHTADTYYNIILKLGVAGNVDDMESFCKEMVKEKCPFGEEALVELIDSLIKQHCRLDEAFQVFVVMVASGYKPEIEMFNFVLGAFVEGKREFNDVLFVYKEMVKAGIPPNVDTLNYLLEALLDDNRVDSALYQYRRMERKGCSPNCRTYEILICGLIEKNKVAESVIVLDEMFRGGCEGDLRFYARTIPLYARLNRVVEGWKLFQKMRDSKLVLDSLVYEGLLHCLCEDLWLNEAVILVEEMMERSMTLPENVFVTMVNGFYKLGIYSVGRILLEKMTIWETSACNALLEGYRNSCNFHEVKSLFDVMVKKDVADNFSWNILIRWSIENAGIKKASEFLSRMIVSSFIPDCATYSILIEGNCRVNKYMDALTLFCQTCASSWVVDLSCYAELVKVLCNAKRFPEAVEVYHYMSRNRCPLESFSLNMLIVGLCAEEKVDDAIRVRSLAYHSGTYCTNTMYSSIMLGLSKSERINDLLLVLSQMLVEGCSLNNESYGILINSLSTQNRAEDCSLLLTLMVDDGLVPDSETLTNLLLCLANNSQLHGSLVAIDKIISHCDVFDSSMYNILVNGLWKEGYKSEANRLLDMMLDKGWVPDAMTHGMLMGSVVKVEMDGETLPDESFTLQDNVDNILMEGFGHI